MRGKDSDLCDGQVPAEAHKPGTDVSGFTYPPGAGGAVIGIFCLTIYRQAGKKGFQCFSFPPVFCFPFLLSVRYSASSEANSSVTA